MKAELESLLGDEALQRVPEKSNGVDDLRFVLMISKVRLAQTSTAMLLPAGGARVEFMRVVGGGVWWSV